MLDKKLIELLKPLRIKYYFSKLMIYVSYSFLAFSSFLLMLMILSKVIPVTFIWTKIILALGMSLVFGLLWSIYKFPSYYETARLVDSFGLKERTITALELKGNDSRLAELQKKDAVYSLDREDIKKHIFIKPSMKIADIAMLMILSSIIVGFIKTPSHEEALLKEKNKNIVKNEIESIKKIEKEVKEEKLLTLEEKKQIENILKELRKKLDKSENMKDIQKEALKAKKELKNIEEKLRQEKIEDIAKKLSDKKFTKELAENLKDKNAEKTAESIEKMAQEIKNMDKEKLESLAKDVAALAEQLKDNPDLKNAFNQLSEAISQNIEGNIDDAKLSNSLNSLEESLSGLMSDSQVSGAISQLNEALDNLSELDSQGNNSGSNSQGSQGGQGNSGQGGQGQGNGQGQGSGNGQGSGTGQGAGGGAGEGSSPGNENSSGNSSGQSGKKEGSKKEVKEYESVFTPKNLGGEGNQTQVHGNMNNSGDKDVIQVKKFGDMKGESMPYNEVLNMYKQNAYKRLDNEEIPPNMKEVIRKYFSDLE
ncbi:hypothetical protein [Proteiniborus sp. MB09-C3]|uniref:hypothetical protein n=1 Tax=Proteiniborus sp. MB09-C3 TaxID=3050072 RepID=UPI0025558E4D|nr:hypothetical protein [Proteiniborus sp. MB09-C3]WIV11509.1 hypothetical protein QO263_15615 [Proteiniborus sp. MB09-C3]